MTIGKRDWPAAVSAASLGCLLPIYLGLLDIWHGEPNVNLEWNVVWAFFWAMVLLHGAFLAALTLAFARQKARELRETEGPLHTA